MSVTDNVTIQVVVYADEGMVYESIIQSMTAIDKDYLIQNLMSDQLGDSVKVRSENGYIAIPI